MSWAEDDDQAELLASTRFTSHIDFTADAAFDLFFTDYIPNPSGSNVSGFTFDLLDGVSGSAIQHFTNGAATGCVDDGDPPEAGAPVTGNCTFITALGDTGGDADLALTPSELVAALSGFVAGSYRHGFSDSETPVSGQAFFQAADAAVVPLPRPRCRCSSPGLPASAS